MLAVMFGPFPDSDAPVALITGFTAITAMAIQNSVQRVHLGALPPTTIMTGNTTQATLDGISLLWGMDGEQGIVIRTRFHRLLGAIFCFATGCAAAASLWIGLWGLIVPIVVGSATIFTEPED